MYSECTHRLCKKNYENCTRGNNKKFYDKPIATDMNTTVSDPEIINAVCMARI